MTARKLGLFLLLVAVIGLTFFSNFNAASAFGSKSASGTVSNLTKSVSEGSPELTDFDAVAVRGHKITANELQALKNKVGVSVEGLDYNLLVGSHGTGLRAPTVAEWQKIAQTGQIVESVTYVSSPATVDNSLLPCFPPIGNQGGEGSCVAWSVGYYVKTFQEAKERGWNLSAATWLNGYSGYPTPSYQSKIMSPDFVYHLINGGVDRGATFQDAINVVCFVGVSSWEKMPYSWTNHVAWPSEQAWTEASLYRGNSSGIQYMSIDTNQKLDSLKNWIAANNLAIIGVDAYKIKNQTTSLLTSDDMLTLDNYMNPSINHANTVVGFDDNINYTERGQPAQGAFKIANSWGKGGWEHVSDGFYWISYEAMKQRVGLCMFYHDLIDYQPELAATFSLTHAIRGDCQITVGIGSTSSPMATKSFTQYISGGGFPFPANNIVLDITEFKNQLPRLYNQSYFLKVRDLGTPLGTSTMGTVTSFSIGNVSSQDAPRATINNDNIYLTVFYLVILPELTASPTSGPSGATTTLSGVTFTPNRSVNISYLNPATLKWISVANNTATNSEGQFNYSLKAPDLMQSSLAGDYPAAFDLIVFRAVDNGNGLSCNTTIPYTEWRRSLTRVGNAQAAGVFGNATDLTSTVAIVSGQTSQVEGKWFSPGDVTLYWDGTVNVGTAIANETGYFTASFTVPVTVAGRHIIVLRNGNVDFFVFVARLPFTVDDYDGSWRTSDFTINLSPDASNCETYYKINGGAVRRVAVDGQPRIVTEGGNNTLEYWSVDEFGNEELPHKTLTQVKLDKTAPLGSIQIGSGAKYSMSVYVTLTLTATDSLSGVNQVRLSNDGVWDIEVWETPLASKDWVLTLGDGVKTVYYQIMDSAGLISSYSVSITLDMTKPSVSAGTNQVVTAGNLIIFAPSVCEDNVGISSSVWDFGDGTTANGPVSSHTYLSSGTYMATLTVQDFAGNTASSSFTVIVQSSVSSTIPEFSAPLLFPLILAITLSAVIMKRKSLSAKQ